MRLTMTVVLRTLLSLSLALAATSALAVFPVPAAKDGVIFGANVRAPRGVLPLGAELYFTDGDLGICRAVPIYEPISAPGDAVLTVDPAACIEVIPSGPPASFATSDPSEPSLRVDIILVAQHAGIERLARSGVAQPARLDLVAAPLENGTQLLPSAIAYDEWSGYAYVGYSNSDRIDRFVAESMFATPVLEECVRTSDGTPTRALTFVDTNLFVAQVGGTGDGALGVAENIAGTGCGDVPGASITAATTFDHQKFAAITGLAAGRADDFASWLFVAESVNGSAVIHRLKITEGSAFPDEVYVPEVYSHTGRFVDLQTTDAYRGDVALTYVTRFEPGQPFEEEQPGVLFVSDDPGPATTQPGGRIWSMSDMLPPVIDSPASGSQVVQVSIVGAWPGDDRYALRGTVALLFDEEGYVVASGNADANSGGAFTLAYPDAAEGERRFVIRTADSVGEQTFNVSPPSEVLVLTVSASSPGSDVTPPAAPTFTTPLQGAVVRTSTVTFSGTAEPGSTLVLTIDGEVAGSVAIGASGGWSVGVSLTPGAHIASAVARDSAGNTSAEATVAFTIDTGSAAASGGSGGGGGCSTGFGGSGLSLLLAVAALARRRR